jgi:hypothetical protein
MPRAKILTPEERYRELALYFFDHIDLYGEFSPKNFKPSINRGTTRDSLFIDLLENEDTVRSVLSNQGEVEMLGNVDQPINALIDHMKNELSRHSIKYLEDYNYLKGILKAGDIELIRDTLQREKSVDDTERVSELKKRPSYKLLIKQLEEKIQGSEGIDFADDDGEFSDGWEDVNEIEPQEPEPEPEHLNESLRLSPRSEQGSESGSETEFWSGSESGSDEEPERTFPLPTRSTLSPRRRSQAMDESRGRPPTPGFGERVLKCLDRTCAPRASKKKNHTKKKKNHTKKKKKHTKKKKKQTKKKQTRTSRRRRR